MEKTVSTHEAKTPFGRRVYQLNDTTVEVSGDIPLKGRFEITIVLAELNVRYDRLWVRSNYFTVGLWFFAISILGYLIETAIAGMDGWSTPAMFTLMWAFVGAAVLLMGSKKYQIARFKTKAGVAALDVFEDGPNKAAFPSFVAALVDRIGASKENA